MCGHRDLFVCHDKVHIECRSHGCSAAYPICPLPNLPNINVYLQDDDDVSPIVVACICASFLIQGVELDGVLTAAKIEAARLYLPRLFL